MQSKGTFKGITKIWVLLTLNNYRFLFLRNLIDLFFTDDSGGGQNPYPLIKCNFFNWGENAWNLMTKHNMCIHEEKIFLLIMFVKA